MRVMAKVKPALEKHQIKKEKRVFQASPVKTRLKAKQLNMDSYSFQVVKFPNPKLKTSPKKEILIKKETIVKKEIETNLSVGEFEKEVNEVTLHKIQETPTEVRETPSENQVSPNEDRVTPNENKVSSNENQVSSNGNLVTSSENQVSSNKNLVTPSNKKVSPNENQVTPNEIEVTPEDTEVKTKITPPVIRRRTPGRPKSSKTKTPKTLNKRKYTRNPKRKQRSGSGSAESTPNLETPSIEKEEPIKLPKKRGRKPKSLTQQATPISYKDKKVEPADSETSSLQKDIEYQPNLPSANAEPTEGTAAQNILEENITDKSSETVAPAAETNSEKCKLENLLLFDRTPADDEFIPEVVIWGDQIQRTIKEVTNFYIVGSRNSLPIVKAEQGETPADDSSFLKKIQNKPFTRRRGKARPVQLMTLEEHRKILQACLQNPHARGCCDFKVDSLFRRGMETRRKSYSRPVYLDTVNTTNGSMILETSTDPNSFTIGFEDGHIVIDDVANYECVDGTNQTNGKCTNAKCSECEHQRRKRSTKLVLDLDGNWDVQCDEHGKPRCTYTDLIERALVENEDGLTVSEIYNWISTRFSYYSPTDDRWKNSVRHNLSINPYFKKGGKSKSGAGHVWTVSEECKYFRPALKRRQSMNDTSLDSCPDIDMSLIKTDTDRAVASILGQYSKACEDESQVEENTNGITFCDEYSNANSSSDSEFKNASGEDVQYLENQNNLSTIEYSDLNSTVHSGCLFNMEDYSRGQVVYITQADVDRENESNKENVDGDVAEPVEYTILQSSIYSDAGMNAQNQGLTQELTGSQTEALPELSDMIFTNTESGSSLTSMSHLFESDNNDLSMGFHFEDGLGGTHLQE